MMGFWISFKAEVTHCTGDNIFHRLPRPSPTTYLRKMGFLPSPIHLLDRSLCCAIPLLHASMGACLPPLYFLETLTVCLSNRYNAESFQMKKKRADKSESLIQRRVPCPPEMPRSLAADARK